MEINITARHLELTPDLHDYAEDKVKKVEKYFNHIIDAHVILSSRKYRQIAEVIIHAPGLTVNGEEEANDMYAAIDLVMDNVGRQIKKYKEKLKAKSRLHRAARRDRKKAVDADMVAENVTGDLSPEDITITETKKVDLKPMSLEEAITQMKALKHDKWAFLNSDTNKINFIYKKDDDDYGIMELN
ncbi:MAG: ribosome-associated translation inhibitor RaiA [bacterium]